MRRNCAWVHSVSLFSAFPSVSKKQNVRHIMSKFYLALKFLTFEWARHKDQCKASPPIPYI